MSNVTVFSDFTLSTSESSQIVGAETDKDRKPIFALNVRTN